MPEEYIPNQNVGTSSLTFDLIPNEPPPTLRNTAYNLTDDDGKRVGQLIIHTWVPRVRSERLVTAEITGVVQIKVGVPPEG